MADLVPPSLNRGTIARLAPVEGLATLLVALLTIMAIGSLAVAAVLLDRASLLGDTGATELAILDAVDRGARAKRLYELGVFVTAVVWIRWQFQVVRNAHALGRPTAFAPGWAIAGWFIPGVNLFVPQHQLAVSAESSDPGGSPSTPRVLYAWWAGCVATLALLAIGTVVRPPEEEFARSRFGDFQAADRVHAACMAAAFVTAILGMLTVFACSKRQEELMAGGAGRILAPLAQSESK
jgi:hypothetical protein